MKKIAIVCDNWKLPHFKEGLAEEKFSIEFEGPFSDQATVLKVPCENDSEVLRLADVVQGLQIKCANLKN